ncbi:MAG: hypothetical protein LBU04_00580 [Christensenellaceae bacterium]|jgi:hypothetical protein|nr:hypothetical protein [Christensenellaceae bacterium]
MTVESIKTVNVLGLDFSMHVLRVDSNVDSLIARFYRGSQENSKTTQVIPPRKAARIEESRGKSDGVPSISRIIVKTSSKAE